MSYVNFYIPAIYRHTCYEHFPTMRVTSGSEKIVMTTILLHCCEDEWDFCLVLFLWKIIPFLSRSSIDDWKEKVNDVI